MSYKRKCTHHPDTFSAECADCTDDYWALTKEDTPMSYTIALPAQTTVKFRGKSYRLSIPELPTDLVRHFALFGLKVMMMNTAAGRTFDTEIAKSMKDRLDYLIKIHKD
jgi:hypothetical protein